MYDSIIIIAIVSKGVRTSGKCMYSSSVAKGKGESVSKTNRMKAREVWDGSAGLYARYMSKTCINQGIGDEHFLLL